MMGATQEEIDNKVTYFQSKDGGPILSILESKLDLFPDSLLSRMRFYTGMRDCKRNTFQTSFDLQTLEIVVEFYQQGVWRNPFIKGNQLSIDKVEGGFDQQCEYLGLPSGPIADVIDENDQYNEIDTDHSFEDDFFAEWSEEFDECNFDDDDNF